MDKKVLSKLKDAIESFEFHYSGKSMLNGGYATVNKIKYLYKINNTYIVYTETEIGDYFDCDNPRKEIFTNCKYIIDANTFKLLDDNEVENRKITELLEDEKDQFLIGEGIDFYPSG